MLGRALFIDTKPPAHPAAGLDPRPRWGRLPPGRVGCCWCVDPQETLWVEWVVGWYGVESPTILLRDVPHALTRWARVRPALNTSLTSWSKRLGLRPGPECCLTRWSSSGGGALGPAGSEPPARRERRGSRNARSRGREDVAGITWAGGRDTKYNARTVSGENEIVRRPVALSIINDDVHSSARGTRVLFLKAKFGSARSPSVGRRRAGRPRCAALSQRIQVWASETGRERVGPSSSPSV